MTASGGSRLRALVVLTSDAVGSMIGMGRIHRWARDWVAARTRRERGDLEALFAAFADDIVWVNHTPTSTFYGEHKGVDGMRAMIEKIGSELDISHFQLQTLVADGDHVVALVEQGFTNKSTGAAHQGPLIHVREVHDGRITRVDEFEGDL
jgi:ketosteroid isomerase-like protein